MLVNPPPLLASQVAWATDIHTDCYAGDIEALGASWAAAYPGADTLLITGDIGTSVNLAEALADLQRGWRGRLAFVLGNHDRWHASFREVDNLIRRLCAERPGLIWLTEAAPIELSPRCALVGIDGFYDCGWGNGAESSRFMNDWSAIGDLAGQRRPARAADLQARGHRNAAAGEIILRRALASYDEVLFATHVPPWRDAVIGDPEAYPWYIARFMGEMIERVALENPSKKIRVLAGHIHEPRNFDVSPNVSCSTGSAIYRHPAIYTCIDIPR